jgi:cell division protein FtsI (penicillin-binding protein 3)
MTAETTTETRTQARAGRPMRLRAICALGLVAVLLVALIGRLAQLQIAEAAHYRELAREQQFVTRPLSARRGEIRDRNGALLANSVDAWSVFVDPAFVDDVRETAAALSFALEMDEQDLGRRIAQAAARERRFVWIKRHVTDGEARACRRLDLCGVFMRREYRRVYPQGSTAAHVIGFTDIDGRGLAGVELQLDRALTGVPGSERLPCDGRRRHIRIPDLVNRVEPRDGRNVHLTLDLNVQVIAEQELEKAVQKHKPDAGVAIVLDPRDGSVLAMACRPDFSPRDPSSMPVANQRNMAITDAYEFGSVMKPVIVACALDDGVVTPQREIFCENGAWHVGSAGRVVRDAGSHSFGNLTVAEIVVHSSNIGMGKLGRMMGVDRLCDGLEAFGLTAPTGIALPGEAGGIVLPRERWNEIHSVISVAFGQEVAVTPIAMARAYAALANGGEVLQPRIVSRIEDPHAPDGPRTVYEAPRRTVAGRAVSRRNAAAVMRMMHRVVEEGTGRNCQLDNYTVAGKTGTAQMINPGGRGYSASRYFSSFIAVAPVEAPRAVVLVSLKAPSEGGHYGGTVSAPAVRNILRRTLEYLGAPTTPIDRSGQGRSH